MLAVGEYSHALRLTSELVDLRAANANRRACFASARFSSDAIPANRKGTHMRAFSVVLDSQYRYFFSENVDCYLGVDRNCDGPRSVGITVPCL